MVTVLAGAAVDNLRSPSLWVPRNKGEAPSNFSLMTSSVPSGNEVSGVNGEGTKTLSLKVMGRSCWARVETSQVRGLTTGFDEPSGRRIPKKVPLGGSGPRVGRGGGGWGMAWVSLDGPSWALWLFWYSLSHPDFTFPDSPSMVMGFRWALNEWNMATTQWIALGATLSQVMGMVGTWKERSLLGPPLVVQVQVRGSAVEQTHLKI
ncbi:hypothetical protein EDC04DRAFT_2612642 [Pisolithus marmoratus]|nr:hypothetical protein EDC04DRAFT_2612642 [Pisolithus marmoratus]